MYSTSHATGPVLTVFPFASTPKAPAHVSQLLQNLLARHHPSRQYPSLRSKRNCSPRMMKNAAIAVKKPTIVTVTQSTLRSIALKIFPLVDLLSCDKLSCTVPSLNEGLPEIVPTRCTNRHVSHNHSASKSYTLQLPNASITCSSRLPHFSLGITSLSRSVPVKV